MNVILRDIHSGLTLEVDERTANRYLSHAVFGERLVVVDSAKPEVLTSGSDAEIVDGEKALIAPAAKNDGVTDVK